MYTLRCTAKLLARLKTKDVSDPLPSETLLGDWYATLFRIGPAQLVLCASEKTLLPVVLPARDLSSLAVRLPIALEEMHTALRGPRASIEAELMRMRGATFAKTANRRVLGSMNDFVGMAQYSEDPTIPLLDVSLQLARSPCSPIGMKFPDQETHRVLTSAEELLH